MYRLAAVALAFAAMQPAIAAGTPAEAETRPPERNLGQLRHTRWTVEDGAPPLIRGITQDRDGFIWLASSNGLFRFDGIRFDAMPVSGHDDLPPNFSAVIGLAGGAVLAAYDDGAMVLYRKGRFHRVPPMPDAAPVIYFRQGGDGTIWAVLARTDRPILRYGKGAWTELGEKDGLPAGWLINIHATHGGDLWVTTLDAVYSLAAGQRRFRRIAPVTGHAAVTEAGDGTIWLSDDRGTRAIMRRGRPVQEAATYATPSSVRNFSTMFDAQGHLWGVTGNGMFRTSPQDNRTEIFTAAQGLTSDRTGNLTLDRQGNGWVATTLGLDRFSATSIVPESGIGPFPTFGFVLHGAVDGTVYLGSGSGVWRIRPGQPPEPVNGTGGTVKAFCDRRDGVVHIFVDDRLLRLSADGLRREEWPFASRASVRNCVVDRNGTLFAGAGFSGLFRRNAGGWQELAPWGADDSIDLLFKGPNGYAYGTLQSGRLVRFDRDGDRAVTLMRHDAGGEFGAVAAHDGAIYASVRGGLYRIGAGKAAFLSQKRASWLRGVNGIVHTAGGQSWMIGMEGVAGLPTRDLDRAFDDPAFEPQPRLLGFAQGLSNYGYVGAGPGMVQGGDGRIWIRTLSAVAWLDPSRPVRDAVAPPVRITAAQWASGRVRDPDRITLPAGTGRLAIEYTALALSAPRQTNFRYRLEGLDEDWVDAGTLRQANYANLAPGHYRFRVIARNADGVWNEEGATLEIDLPPAFIQSALFAWLCALGIVLLGVLAYRVRLERLKEGIGKRFAVQMAERERIARELHDTLLQGVQGLMLRLQATADRLRPDEAAHRELEQALVRAETLVVEARDKVRNLRDPMAGSLSDALQGRADMLQQAGGPAISVSIHGTEAPVRPEVIPDLTAIAEEALRNAVTHAKASSVHVQLTFGATHLDLCIADDGTGIPPEALQARADNHFGLIGMRERAARIGAKLEIDSSALEIDSSALGTAIRVKLTAKKAYAAPLPFWRRWPAQRFRPEA
ncbi:triple tyrosine motif-containing protein [Croceicoccus sp. Ery5]|uniref:sensor histidine kinase n=1 Tax=Croceicoccus sp. Ery5 TaxID=1703340 RepID=UPI001E51BD65|nr:triple tyrosine motif-containing protein [Croceicoccus sp. Ery5]